jgi:PAS domain S-box-containing protein
MIGRLLNDPARLPSFPGDKERGFGERDELERIYRDAPIGMCVLDRELRYVRINKHLAQINGLPIEAHLGRRVEEIVPALAGHIRDATSRILATGEGEPDAEICGETPACPGEFRFWSERWYPVRDKDDKIVRFCVEVKDITDRKWAEQALRESEARLRLALEATNTGMWTWELATDAVSWSTECYAIHGVAEGRFAGTGAAFFELVHPDDRARVEATVRSAIESRELYECDFRVVRPGGEVVWAANRGRASCDDSGRAVRMTGTITDNTARKRAELALAESEERFRTLVERADAGIVLADLTGRITQANDRYCALLGYPRERLIGRHFADITHPDDVPSNVALFDALLRTGQPVFTEKRYVRADGAELWVTASVTLVRGPAGRPQHAVVVVHDIDARKRAEAALALADRRKNEFMAILAHELRTPLAAVQNALHIMGMPDGAERARFAQVLPMLRRQVRQMSRLLDDLLDVSRVAQGKIELRKERIELQDVIVSAVEASRPLIEEMGHRLEIRLPRPVRLHADPVRLAQVFSTLLNNAAKYMDRGGCIVLVAETQGNEVTVSVLDHGVGIPAASLRSIFKAFSQIEESRARSRGGLGIGLSLVSGLVALHGGRIEARSEGPGRGSEFVVHLPVADDEEARDPGRPDLRNMAVDDNADGELAHT